MSKLGTYLNYSERSNLGTMSYLEIKNSKDTAKISEFQKDIIAKLNITNIIMQATKPE